MSSSDAVTKPGQGEGGLEPDDLELAPSAAQAGDSEGGENVARTGADATAAPASAVASAATAAPAASASGAAPAAPAAPAVPVAPAGKSADAGSRASDEDARERKKLKRAKRKELKRAKRKKRKRKKRQARLIATAKELHENYASDEVMIKFDHVTKTYKLFRNDRDRFVTLFGLGKRRSVETVNANDDLSFQITRGESVAFLGLNGAGKSTALKMITGVTHPTSGEITVNGRVSALLELSAGFDRKLTGRENLRLRSQIMGLTEEDMAEIIPQAIEFANLGVYIDQPMTSYSSGMRARLGFALAVSVKPEILVVDEALSVGDRRFKRKCIKRIREIMMDESVTVLFVTHSSSSAQQFCSRGIVLEQGKLVFDGPLAEAMAFYEASI